jgi:Tfp pilus assembly ATPase PilU
MYSAIQTGQNGVGMQTLDQNLTELVKPSVWSQREARTRTEQGRDSPADRTDPGRTAGRLPETKTNAGLCMAALPNIQRSSPQRSAQLERDQALKFMYDLLRLMVTKRGSDLFVTAGFPPAIKVDGRIIPQSNQSLTPQHTAELARAIMNDRQAAEFESTKECNFAISPAGIGRFPRQRLRAARQDRLRAAHHQRQDPDARRAGLPTVLKDVAMTKRGLTIFVGGTGTGKTTSLAALVDWRNANSYGHIITIEDPIEYVHHHKNCVVTQREVGIDTETGKSR